MGIDLFRIAIEGIFYIGKKVETKNERKYDF